MKTEMKTESVSFLFWVSLFLGLTGGKKNRSVLTLQRRLDAIEIRQRGDQQTSFEAGAGGWR